MLSLQEALQLRTAKTLVFTNGVFDILHAGHVRYLQQARTLGDLLIVGINTDETVAQLKGPTRPVNTLEDRAAVLEALRAVDGVIPFQENTPEELIRKLQPEIHVKGGDYTIQTLPEAQIVQSYGGRVVILETLQGRSTTETLRRMHQD